MKCKLCGVVKEGADHDVTAKHLRNKALQEYFVEKKKLTGNRKGAVVTCSVKSSFSDIIDNADAKIKISAKPTDELKFQFTLFNESKSEELLVVFVQIPSNKLNFVMNDHGLGLGCEPQCLKPKQRLQQEVFVTFKSSDIGQYEMPIAFLFQRKETKDKIFITRDMVVFVEDKKTLHEKIITPYADKEVKADMLLKTDKRNNSQSGQFSIPRPHKQLFAANLRPHADAPQELLDVAKEISDVFAIGATKENYVRFFHNLLWYEETIVRINLKKYNMSGVKLEANDGGSTYSLHVPGLAEKRPSLLAGDLMFVKPAVTDEVMFEATIADTNDNTVTIKGFHPNLHKWFVSANRFDIRFFMSRMIMERLHAGVDAVFRAGLAPTVFPAPGKPATPAAIDKFFNQDVGRNPEQRVAVERAVGGRGPAPYLLHGPPGTGKTVTVAEMILQVIHRDASARVLLCTDSNMAADHAAGVLARYAPHFPGAFLLRANSQHRVWSSLPQSLRKFSNGSSSDSFHRVTEEQFLEHRVVVTTLLHAAKFVRQLKGKRPITHLVIDEAAQASEPACLVAMALLAAPPRARLLLAGDPRQLPPCVISRAACRHGLGLSLMERLMKMDMYQSGDPDYVMMLRNNFRSNADILALPNELFYDGQLRACAPDDPLSSKCILRERDSCRAVVFHGVLSQEQRVGKSPSYFNPMELQLVQRYVTELIQQHGVQQQDIGVVTPYARQVYKVKAWLSSAGYGAVEAGTVEAFQGKEKRVVVVSCVRAQHQLLRHDAKYQLGFLVDDKRFNVALTRAKAKTIIIGNPVVLRRDEKWRRYIERCDQLGSHLGFRAPAAQDDIAPMLDNMRLDG